MHAMVGWVGREGVHPHHPGQVYKKGRQTESD